MAIQMKMILLSVVMLLIAFEPAFTGKILNKLDKELKKMGLPKLKKSLAEIGTNADDIDNNKAQIDNNAMDIGDVQNDIGDIHNVLQGGVCVEYAFDYTGNDINAKGEVYLWTECAKLCNDDKGCQYWTWNMYKKVCLFKSSKNGKSKSRSGISGAYDCLSEGPFNDDYPATTPTVNGSAVSIDADLNEDGQLDLLEASLNSGKITKEDHQRNKQSTGQPEWFTEIDTNQDEFIQLQELDNAYPENFESAIHN